ncbi:MAG: peptide chain release factor N(5)-glutamine methyltransferase [Patescibacteria group bacterium]|nr:peptide chain release factor N(5)-glutamine methyltransferase [Patescibacteria group bacterium]
MNIKRSLYLTEQKFKKAGIKTADLDALLLLKFILKKPKEYILAHPEKNLTKKQEKEFFVLVKKRASRFPVAYILGEQEFYGRKFKVNKNVLIPRPETEKIIELVLKKIKEMPHFAKGFPGLSFGQKKLKILDLGTGSGCIAITLANELDKQKVKYQITASDISCDALKIAKENAKKLIHRNHHEKKPKESQIHFIKKDIFQNIKGKFNIIVANLPYVKAKEIKNELKFEPQLALLDQKQIPQMLKNYKKYLKNQGCLIYETINGKIIFES